MEYILECWQNESVGLDGWFHGVSTFDNISVIWWRSVLLVKESRGHGENHQPVASLWQTLSHNSVNLALIEIRNKCVTALWVNDLHYTLRIEVLSY